ncbi:MAG: ABC transporter permease [Acidimicrobiia bacterium]|nr:ABC transporter permease [Acidimicrobiia bacterium]
MFTRLGYFARETWVSLRRNILMTVAGVLTVAVSLCVLGGALLLTRLVDHGTAQWENGVQFEIFMKTDATLSQVQAVQTQLKNDPDVRTFKYLSHDDAYRQFKRWFASQPDLVSNTRPEDLPESFRVAPRTAALTSLVGNRFVSQAGVDQVNTAPESVKSLLDATRTIRYIFLTIFLALLFAALFLIVNTIRLATFARRREIEVMKLVGASNWFVRIPFLFEGMVQGVIGSAAAVGAVFGLQSLISSSISPTDPLWRGWYVGPGDATQISLYVILIGVAIGGFGAWIGLRRFIDA